MPAKRPAKIRARKPSRSTIRIRPRGASSVSQPDSQRAVRGLSPRIFSPLLIEKEQVLHQFARLMPSALASGTCFSLFAQLRAIWQQLWPVARGSRTQDETYARLLRERDEFIHTQFILRSDLYRLGAYNGVTMGPPLPPFNPSLRPLPESTVTTFMPTPLIPFPHYPSPNPIGFERYEGTSGPRTKPVYFTAPAHLLGSFPVGNFPSVRNPGPSVTEDAITTLPTGDSAAQTQPLHFTTPLLPESQGRFPSRNDFNPPAQAAIRTTTRPPNNVTPVEGVHINPPTNALANVSFVQPPPLQPTTNRTLDASCYRSGLLGATTDAGCRAPTTMSPAREGIPTEIHPHPPLAELDPFAHTKSAHFRVPFHPPSQPEPSGSTFDLRLSNSYTPVEDYHHPWASHPHSDSLIDPFETLHSNFDFHAFSDDLTTPASSPTPPTEPIASTSNLTQHNGLDLQGHEAALIGSQRQFLTALGHVVSDLLGGISGERCQCCSSNAT